MVSYDQNSFLQGIAVGKSLKGWTSGLGTSVPTCWNDEGVYTYFYINYHLPISDITLLMFNLSTKVVHESGSLDVSAVEFVDSTTLKVYCDLSGVSKKWVTVMGLNDSWLYYDSGYAVPTYAATFWLDGWKNYTPGYMEDEGSLTGRYYKGEDSYTISTVTGTYYSYTEDANLPPLTCEAKETCEVTYS